MSAFREGLSQHTAEVADPNHSWGDGDIDGRAARWRTTDDGALVVIEVAATYVLEVFGNSLSLGETRDLSRSLTWVDQDEWIARGGAILDPNDPEELRRHQQERENRR